MILYQHTGSAVARARAINGLRPDAELCGRKSDIYPPDEWRHECRLNVEFVPKAVEPPRGARQNVPPRRLHRLQGSEIATVCARRLAFRRRSSGRA